MKPAVLIIDDDVKICTLLTALLQQNGYIVFYALDTTQARSLLKYISFHILLVDYMMPNENGIQFIESLQSKKITIPTLMLTAVDEIDNKIKSLTAGSNDYLTKPFNSQELLLRINNLIKLSNSMQHNSTEVVKIGNLYFNQNTNTLKFNDTILKLSSLEEDILKILVNNLNKVIEKEDILKALSKPITQANLTTLNVNIMRLRKKLQQDNHQYIKTVRGKGFILSSVE